MTAIMTETRRYKRRPGACEGCKSRKLKCDGGEPTCNKCQATSNNCRYLSRKKRGKASRSSISTVEATSVSCESPEISYSQSESYGSDLERIWPSLPTFEMDGLAGPITSIGSLQLGDHDLSIPDSLLLDGGHGSNVISSFDTSPQVFDNFSLSAFSPISSEFRTIEGKSELESRVAELYQSFDVVDFSGATLLSRITAFSSRHNLTSESMEKAIQDILCQIDLPRDNSQIIDTKFVPDDNLGSLRSCLATFLEQPYMGANYIDRDGLLGLFNEVVITKRDDAASIALVYGAIATGAKHERAWKPNKSSSYSTIAPQYFENAVEILRQSGGKYSTTRFKAVLTLLSFAVRWVPDEVPKLLADCTAHAQVLRLNSRHTLTVLCRDPQEEARLKEGFWLLYVIEKRYSMRMGQFSVLPDDHIDHILPGLDNHSNYQNKELFTQCLFARLSSHAVHKILGREARNVPLACQRDQCLRLLEAWKDCSFSESAHRVAHAAFDKLSNSVQYFELLLCIHALELSQPALSNSFEKAQLSILIASQDILGLLNDIDNFNVAADWGFVRTIILAFCSSASLLRVAPDRSTLLKYMGSALGYFARLSMVSSIPFEKFNLIVAEAFRLSSHWESESEGWK